MTKALTVTHLRLLARISHTGLFLDSNGAVRG
jgi:hypothetical protein